MPTAEPRLLLDAQMMRRSMRRIAHEILEQNQGTDNLLVVGIQTRGVNLAERLVAELSWRSRGCGSPAASWISLFTAMTCAR